MIDFCGLHLPSDVSAVGKPKFLCDIDQQILHGCYIQVSFHTPDMVQPLHLTVPDIDSKTFCFIIDPPLKLLNKVI